MSTQLAYSNWFNSRNSFSAEGNKFVRGNWETLYGNPLTAEMKEAYELQMRRVGQLLEGYKQGGAASKKAREEIEEYMTGEAHLNMPRKGTQMHLNIAAKVRGVVDKVARSAYDNSIPFNMVSEFTHTVSDFPTLTLACVRRQLQRLSESTCEDDCLDDLFATLPARAYCENNAGLLGLIPMQAPDGAGCPHGEGCSCSPAYWRLGETTRGEFNSYLYADYVRWSWKLAQCSQYGGFTDEVTSWLLKIKRDRKRTQRASMLVNPNGLNANIFNTENNNIITAADGSCNPGVTCIADAYYLLEHFSKQWAYHQDRDGLPVCNRDLKIVTGDWDVACIFKKAISSSLEEEVNGINAAGECVKGITASSDATCLDNFMVCYSKDLRQAQTPKGMKFNDPNHPANCGFVIMPMAGGTTDTNVFVEAPVQGFETVQIAQKANAWQDLQGRGIQALGSDYCWNQEVMFVDGYGYGTNYPELAFASDGKGTECA